MRKAKPMVMAMAMPMPMPIWIGTFWYFFQKIPDPSSLDPCSFFQSDSGTGASASAPLDPPVLTLSLSIRQFQN